MMLELLRNSNSYGKFLGILFIFSFGWIVISTFITPQNINAQESVLTTVQGVTSSQSSQLKQSIPQDEITSSPPYYPGDSEGHLKIYEKYGNTVTAHPGESFLSTAECNNNDVIIGGGANTSPEFSNLTAENMPNGFQKDPKKWIVEGSVPQDGTTIEITSIAFCAIK
jgi:hypothetical protein